MSHRWNVLLITAAAVFMSFLDVLGLAELAAARGDTASADELRLRAGVALT